MEPTIVVAEPQRPPVQGRVILIVLLLAVPLLSALVLQQQRVIEAQRVLIRQLFGDTRELNAIRIRDQQNHAKQAAPATKPQAQAPAANPAPEKKERKQNRQEKPAFPQEYPAQRHIPVRNAI